jgi:putative transposase
MDGRRRCYDNIFIERLWRSLKYELIYIQEFADGKELTEEVNKWFYWYNQERPHQALDYQTPDEVYRQILTMTRRLSLKNDDQVQSLASP